MKNRESNKGFSLMELIIAVSIMAILIAVLVPSYMRYVAKSRRAVDLANGEKIGRAFQIALVEYPEANDVYMNWNGSRKLVSVTVNGRKENYYVFNVMTNKPDAPLYNGAFSGAEAKFKDKNGNPGLYTFVNNTLGISSKRTLEENKIMMPKYNVSFDQTAGVSKPSSKYRLRVWF